MKKTRPIFKNHGGKAYLVNFVISNFPKHYAQLKYIEGCSGACSILLNKEQSTIEIVNDADKGIVSIIRELINNSNNFIDVIKKTEYNKETFEWSKITTGPLAELVRRRFSRGGLGRTFSWSERLRGGQKGEKNAWQTFKLELVRIAERLKNVKVYCLPISELFDQLDAEDVLWYIDPPYLPITRQAHNVYNVEMTEKQHIELAERLNKAKGRVLLSGYQSSLYAKLYKDWNLDCCSIANHSGQGKSKQKRVEILWRNY